LELEKVVLPPPTAGPIQALVVGAMVLFLLRLLLIFPADLWARLIGNPERNPLPGTLAAWLVSPEHDEHFFRLFVLATWWIGALVGVVLVRQRGGRLSDLPLGALAGSVAGMGGAATLASVLTLIDNLPRLLLRGLPLASGGSVPLGTILWCITALLCWTVLGGVLGLVLGSFGRSGLRVLATVSGPAAWLARLCGLGRMADFFSLQG
jgi:hypothetical protein